MVEGGSDTIGIEVVDNNRNEIKQCIDIQTFRLELSKKKMYSLMASRMDKDDHSD